MSTIIKVITGFGYTKSGKQIPMNKIVKIRPGDANYEEEAKAKQDFLEAQASKPFTLTPRAGFKSIHVNQSSR